MEKKESYRRHLPHFQQPGQSYFVTWCIYNAVPAKALNNYALQLKDISHQIDNVDKSDKERINQLKIEYSGIRKKYMKAFDDLLHQQSEVIVDLSKEENTRIILDTLSFREGKRIENYAICVMNNHVHWVLRVFEKDENGKPVYLQDILQSVKRFSANKINDLENRTGTLWQDESYDITIRNDLHRHNAIEYTINNPVVAGLVKNWWDWGGTILFGKGL